MKHVLVVFGTRPEAIKMAPVVGALRARAELRTTVCVTGQHREMLDQVLSLFGIVPEVDLGVMKSGQSLADLTAAILRGVDDVLAERQPDVVLVHGDTTTAMAAALAAFYRQVPVGHVEAGLRSGRMDAPFPEEMNRVVVDRLATHLFAPTPGALANLRREGVDERLVTVTGNTAIDALLQVRHRVATLDVAVKALVPADAKRLVLVTAHRREAFGKPFADVCAALQAVATSHPDVVFVYPVHLNPQVKAPARERLSAPNVLLLDPVDYASLVWLLDRSEVVLTDSGGLQEEAPALGKPVLVLRDVTERPELIEAGGGVLVGTNPARIEAEAARLLDDPAHRAAMGRPRALFGDGRAALRVAARLAGEAVQPWRPAPDAAPLPAAPGTPAPAAESAPAPR